jgi:hypothetical protein
MTSYYEIDEKCYKPYGDYEPCLHWIFETYDSEPFLSWSTEILKNNKETTNSDIQKIMQHMIEPQDTKVYSCGNPWNVLSSNRNLDREVRKNKPVTKSSPITRGETAVKFTIKHINVDEKVISREIVETIEASCISVYVRDKHHKPIKVYYDLNKEDTKEEEKEREILYENPKELINHLDEGHEVCLIMGPGEFIDYYVFKTPNSNTYNMMEITY